jgi:hypothetical protein
MNQSHGKDIRDYVYTDKNGFNQKIQVWLTLESVSNMCWQPPGKLEYSLLYRLDSEVLPLAKPPQMSGCLIPQGNKIQLSNIRRGDLKKQQEFTRNTIEQMLRLSSGVSEIEIYNIMHVETVRLLDRILTGGEPQSILLRSPSSSPLIKALHSLGCTNLRAYKDAACYCIRAELDTWR